MTSLIKKKHYKPTNKVLYQQNMRKEYLLNKALDILKLDDAEPVTINELNKHIDKFNSLNRAYEEIKDGRANGEF